MPEATFIDDVGLLLESGEFSCIPSASLISAMSEKISVTRKVTGLLSQGIKEMKYSFFHKIIIF